MNPTEFNSAEGRIRFMILHAMCRAVASKSGWIGMLSNWALGTTAAYVSLMLANLREIQNHLHGTWIGPVFWLAVLSTVVGIGIQFATGWVQIALEVENQIASLALDVLQHPERYQITPQPDYVARFKANIMEPVIREFIESRPWAFAELGKYAQEKAERDPAFIAKTAASHTQMALVFLIVQYILLGTAIFWPLGLLMLRG
jgi:hypothetical protein